MNFIEELYFGNINPNEKRIDKNSQYKKALESFCKYENELNNLLSGQELQIFNKLINVSDEITSCASIESFKIGFVLGVHMMIDCHNVTNKNFKD